MRRRPVRAKGVPRAVWLWLADAVVAAHLAYLAFLPLGGVLTWRWPWVIWAHLTAVAIGVASITSGSTVHSPRGSNHCVAAPVSGRTRTASLSITSLVVSIRTA